MSHLEKKNTFWLENVQTYKFERSFELALFSQKPFF